MKIKLLLYFRKSAVLKGIVSRHLYLYSLVLLTIQIVSKYSAEGQYDQYDHKGSLVLNSVMNCLQLINICITAGQIIKKDIFDTFITIL